MKIETAIKLLVVEYERAKQNDFVYKPLAYALYQVWKIADNEAEKPKRGSRRKGDGK